MSGSSLAKHCTKCGSRDLVGCPTGVAFIGWEIRCQSCQAINSAPKEWAEPISFRDILEVGIREALYQLGPTKWDATRSIAYCDAQMALRALRKIYRQVYVADRKRLEDIEGFKRWQYSDMVGGVFGT
jgi:hypothetical protein